MIHSDVTLCCFRVAGAWKSTLKILWTRRATCGFSLEITGKYQQQADTSTGLSLSKILSKITARFKWHMDSDPSPIQGCFRLRSLFEGRAKFSLPPNCISHRLLDVWTQLFRRSTMTYLKFQKALDMPCADIEVDDDPGATLMWSGREHKGECFDSLTEGYRRWMLWQYRIECQERRSKPYSNVSKILQKSLMDTRLILYLDAYVNWSRPYMTSGLCSWTRRKVLFLPS